MLLGQIEGIAACQRTGASLIFDITPLICLRVRDIIVEDQFKHLDVEEHFYDEFPETVTLDQTVAVWKHIVEYHERLKQE